MFLALDKAQAANPDVTQEDIDALESTVRALTNNHFHIEKTKQKFKHAPYLYFVGNSIVFPTDQQTQLPTQQTQDFIATLEVGSSLEVYGTGVNDGVFEVTGILPENPADPEDPTPTAYNVTVRMKEEFGTKFIKGFYDGIVVLVRYPQNVTRGVLGLLAYDYTIGKKKGIKSETVSRLSVTYFDMTAAESEEGYPTAYTEFLHKYRKMKFD